MRFTVGYGNWCKKQGLSRRISPVASCKVGILFYGIDGFADVGGDGLQFTQSVDVGVESFLLVPVDERSRLAVVNCKTFFDSLFVVISTT